MEERRNTFDESSEDQSFNSKPRSKTPNPHIELTKTPNQPFEDIEEEQNLQASFIKRNSILPIEAKPARNLIRDIYGIREPYAPLPPPVEEKPSKKLKKIVAPKITRLVELLNSSSEISLLKSKGIHYSS